jgi:putative tryptophan/tyrosine transport system substrate-binding protein
VARRHFRSQQRAQQRLLRIGYVSLTTASDSRYLPNFLAGLSDLGYAEGKNLQVELRFADGDDDRLPGLATEPVGLNVDVIVTAASGVPSDQRHSPIAAFYHSLQGSKLL